jgi:TolB-like protein/tetratricopeptide (TPR) repeat protein
VKRWLRELSRRKVIRVAVAYPIVGWLLIQVAGETFGPLGLPSWSVTLVVVLVALGYPLALLLAWAFDITPHGVRRTQAPPAENSVAVLPFLDLSPERDQGYFCEGMAEEIINALTRVRGINVASRTSSFKFLNAPLDAREIGTQLRVRKILEGSVRKAGERLRVTAQLIDVDDGFHLWSKRFDRSLKDVFAIQDEIASEVMRAVAHSPAEKEAVSGRLLPPPTNLEAYDYYLRGRQFFYRFNPNSLAFAVEMFERAIDVSPGYAQAHAGLADTLSFRYMYAERNEETGRLALEHARKALELAPELAEAHASEGLALLLHRRYQTAEQSFRKAIELNPELYEAHYFYARALVQQGRYEDAAAEFLRAAEVNPDEYQARLLLPGVYEALGRPKDKLEAARRGIEAAREHLKCHPDDVRAMYLMAGALITIGEPEQGREIAEKALFFAPDSPPDVLYNSACTFAQLGDTERALDLLERMNLAALANRDWVEHDSDLKSLHGHPRFQKLLELLH